MAGRSRRDPDHLELIAGHAARGDRVSRRLIPIGKGSRSRGRRRSPPKRGKCRQAPVIEKSGAAGGVRKRRSDRADRIGEFVSGRRDVCRRNGCMAN